MSPEEVKAKLDDLAEKLFAASKELENLVPYFANQFDRDAAASIMTDLHWATENCTTIGLHQIGQALDDKMRAIDADT